MYISHGNTDTWSVTAPCRVSTAGSGTICIAPLEPTTVRIVGTLNLSHFVQAQPHSWISTKHSCATTRCNIREWPLRIAHFDSDRRGCLGSLFSSLPSPKQRRIPPGAPRSPTAPLSFSSVLSLVLPTPSLAITPFARRNSEAFGSASGRHDIRPPPVPTSGPPGLIGEMTSAPDSLLGERLRTRRAEWEPPGDIISGRASSCEHRMGNSSEVTS